MIEQLRLIRRRRIPAALAAFAILLTLTLTACDSGPDPPPEEELCTDEEATNTGEPLPCEYDDDPPGGGEVSITLSVSSSVDASLVIIEDPSADDPVALAGHTPLELDFTADDDRQITAHVWSAGREPVTREIDLDVTEDETVELDATLQWKPGFPPDNGGGDVNNPPTFRCEGTTTDESGEIRAFPVSNVSYSLTQVQDAEGDAITAVQYLSVSDELASTSTADETASFGFDSQSEAAVFARVKDSAGDGDGDGESDTNEWSAFTLCSTPLWLDHYPAQPIALASVDGGLSTRAPGESVTLTDAGSFDRSSRHQDGSDLVGNTWRHVAFTDTGTDRPHVTVEEAVDIAEWEIALPNDGSDEGDGSESGVHYFARTVTDDADRVSEPFWLGLPVQSSDGDGGETTITDELTVGGETFTDQVTFDGGSSTRPDACLEADAFSRVYDYPDPVHFALSACAESDSYHWSTPQGSRSGSQVNLTFENDFGPHPVTLWTTSAERQSLPVTLMSDVVYRRGGGGAGGPAGSCLEDCQDLYVSPEKEEMMLDYLFFFFQPNHRMLIGDLYLTLSVRCEGDCEDDGVAVRFFARSPGVETVYTPIVHGAEGADFHTVELILDGAQIDQFAQYRLDAVHCDYFGECESGPDGEIHFADEDGNSEAFNLEYFFFEDDYY